MSIENVLASLAVKDLEAATRWYATLLEAPGAQPMPEVREWTLPRGGVLQLYADAERAGKGSCTLSVTDLDRELGKLERMGVDIGQRSEGEAVRVAMVVDPDGNHLAIAQPLDGRVAR